MRAPRDPGRKEHPFPHATPWPRRHGDDQARDGRCFEFGGRGGFQLQACPAVAGVRLARLSRGRNGPRRPDHGRVRPALRPFVSGRLLPGQERAPEQSWRRGMSRPVGALGQEADGHLPVPSRGAAHRPGLPSRNPGRCAASRRCTVSAHPPGSRAENVTYHRAVHCVRVQPTSMRLGEPSI
jgi:hypothetical protein